MRDCATLMGASEVISETKVGSGGGGGGSGGGELVRL